MKTLDLGTCCPDCFAALNYTMHQIPPSAAKRAAVAGEELSLLCDRENATAIYTGQFEGFSHSLCSGCGCDLAGDRWQLLAHTQRKDIGV